MDENIIRKLRFQEMPLTKEKLKSIENSVLPKNIKSIFGTIYFQKAVEVFSFEFDAVVDRIIEIFFSKGKNGKISYVVRVDYLDFVELKTLSQLVEIIQIDMPNLDEIGFVYFIESQFGIKIGNTKNICKRRAIFNVKLPFEWKFKRIYISNEYKSFERNLHRFFESKRINGEWFNLNETDILFCDRLIS